MMAKRATFTLSTFRTVTRRLLAGPHVLAFVPAVTLAAFWFGGESALLLVALGLPLLVLALGGLGAVVGDGPRDAVTGLPLARDLSESLDIALARGEANGLKTACFLVQIEDTAEFAEHHDSATLEALMERTAGRLRTALRDGDQLCWLGDARFGIALKAVPHLDLEAGIQLAARLQSAVEQPLSMNGRSVYATCAIGFCLSSRSTAKTAHALLTHADTALTEARLNGPSAIRAYSAEMGRQKQKRDTMRGDSLVALENGEIRPWFQPQISTDTGHVTGFEALARWVHPQRGVIPPGDFLPALDHAGQMERLGEVILYGALTAVHAWDAADVTVPCVAVNFTGAELRNPRLPDKIRWDLDRFDLTPDRLTVEVLETVVAGAAGDIATQNIMRLSEMGCRIDLDDFGTGHASIAAIRRFAIERIKIDRSFVTHVDEDAEQQRMVAAILTMAERLGLETLAEGVETAGEHAMLAQLGCRHVQGFGIARPMPFEETLDWIRGHQARLGRLPRIARKSG